MIKSAWKRAGVALMATAVVTGVAGCQEGDAKKAAEAPAKAVTQGLGDATKALTAAFQKTSAAKSAKVTMTMSMEGVGAQSGTATMTGVQGWDPAAMDITMKGSLLGSADPGAPEQVRMIMLDNVMYMDLGAEQAAKMGGKRWMKLDLKAAAEASGDKSLQKQMTGGLDNMNQDPAQQLALLLDSPDLKHVGAEKINGVETQHYKGTLTFEQMLRANKSSKVLSKEQYDELVANVKKAGLKGYDTEIWVNEDGYPARMDVGMTMAQGTVHMQADYTDYGARTEVQAPPAKDTVDLFKMLQEAGQGGTRG
ncbi:hypothetical protein [Streptomyces sp. NPDC051921]|uniref:hypothetical protein n=1 Tax=Streptomyces sp. NPDC051921 TaxID=3155806 RepID=UPI0034478051